MANLLLRKARADNRRAARSFKKIVQRLDAFAGRAMRLSGAVCRLEGARRFPSHTAFYQIYNEIETSYFPIWKIAALAKWALPPARFAERSGFTRKKAIQAAELRRFTTAFPVDRNLFPGEQRLSRTQKGEGHSSRMPFILYSFHDAPEPAFIPVRQFRERLREGFRPFRFPRGKPSFGAYGLPEESEP